jgi:iron complex transport system substrate-binding protein
VRAVLTLVPLGPDGAVELVSHAGGPLGLRDILFYVLAAATVAGAAGVPDRGRVAVARLQGRIDAVTGRSASVTRPPRVMLLEWIDPPFTAGHWSPEIVSLAGGQEILGRQGEKSRSVPWEEIVAADPEVLVIACCGFDIPRIRQDLPILLAQPGFSGLACARDRRVFLVDGNAYFSRPGPRLVESLEILAHALDPALHPLPIGLRPAERLSAAELGMPPI